MRVRSFFRGGLSAADRQPAWVKAGLASFWTRPADEVLSALRTRPEGPPPSEAAVRLRQEPGIRPRPRWQARLSLLTRQFTTPMTLILTVATLISRFLGEVVDALTILAMVLLSGLLGYWQEQSAANWLELGEPQR